MSDNYPDEFFCPITKMVMQDPVSIECGHTFEKSAIEQWFENFNVCPECRNSSNGTLVTNWALKSLINNYGQSSGASSGTNVLVSQATVSQDSVSQNLEAEERVISTESLKSLKLSFKETDKIYLELEVPRTGKRRPVAFVCVIDVSGSMGSAVGKFEGSKAFTRLDLVKHVLNVLIATMDQYDYLSLITFSNNSELVLDLCKMTKENKRLAKNYVKTLEPLSNTYTGPALKLAYKTMEKAPNNHIKSIILLTDGEDSAGEDMVFNIFDRIKKQSGVELNTFGFSNEINSHCLDTLAKKGNGIFGYIPDQTMIGTIFINFLANTYLTFAQDLLLDVGSNFKFDSKNQPKKISLHYGQKRHVIIVRDGSLNSRPVLKVGFSLNDMVTLHGNQSSDELNIDYEISKVLLLKYTTDPRLPNIKPEELDAFIKTIKCEEFLKEFVQTDENNPNNEQLKLCLNFWKTWGAHYLRSFAFAHSHELCLNFRSPSMAVYRHEDFDNLVDQFTDIFCTLPPPEATGVFEASVASTVSPISMTGIMNPRGGCIYENCKIKMNSGGYKPIKMLKKGDVIEGGAKVVCLIKSVYIGLLIRIGKLIITPYHPVYYSNKWQFPQNIYENNFNIIDKRRNYGIIRNDLNPLIVCNVVLDRDHIIKCEGVECITLGHGYTNGILNHPYYGTQMIINELKTLNGWDDGLITIKNCDYKCDENGLICGMTKIQYVS